MLNDGEALSQREGQTIFQELTEAHRRLSIVLDTFQTSLSHK